MIEAHEFGSSAQERQLPPKGKPMSEDTDRDDQSELVPAVRFARAERGKYSGFLAHGAPPVDVHVWAPLSDFRWRGSERKLYGSLWIRPSRSYSGYDRPEFRDRITAEDLSECRSVSHWLSFIRPAQGPVSSQVTINQFLIALWVAKPTATQVRLRFEAADSDVYLVARHLDRVQWIEGQVEEEVNDADLDEVERMLPAIHAAYLEGRRLKTALGLTFRGCVSVEWQSAFICLAAAAETLLTFSRGSGLVERLGDAYAKLTASCKSETAEAVKRFKRLYSVRSDIVHGKSYDRQGQRRNLKDLAEFSNLLRHLWSVILRSDEALRTLDGDDSARESFFRRL